MAWAVLGSSGMLGSDLEATLARQNRAVTAFTRENIDFSQSAEKIASALDGNEVIVNCVAYTAVDKAETEPDLARFANATIPQKLALAAEIVGARLIHISTDYVFDGAASQPYSTSSTTNPVSVYGVTKRLGEEHVLGYDSGHVVRTAWLYGASGTCFPKTIASRLLAGKSVAVVNDQVGSPTHTKDLSELLIQVGLTKQPQSVYHGVSKGSATWYSFAKEIAVSLDALAPGRIPVGMRSFTELVSPTTSDAYPTPAKRPAFSLLEPSVVDGHSIPSWQESWHEAAVSVLGDLLG
jgi:dTDP-4-dehydrorhamnose reductase